MILSNIPPSLAWLRRAIVPAVLAAVLALPAGMALGQVAQAPTALDADAKGDLDQLLRDKGLIDKLAASSGQIASEAAGRASDLVVAAMGFLGVPYKRGGNSFESGFDCSGFVKALYEQTVGLVLPRKAEQQAAATQSIDKSELQPGDLVFFNTLRRAFSHVGIYVGDGKFIHSPRAGAEVRVEDMQKAYWNKRYDGARRVALSSTDAKN